MIAFVKSLILWAEMIGACLGDAATPSLAFNIDTAEGHVVMSASVDIEATGEVVDCLSAGLAELGW